MPWRTYPRELRPLMAKGQPPKITLALTDEELARAQLLVLAGTN